MWGLRFGLSLWGSMSLRVGFKVLGPRLQSLDGFYLEVHG